MKFFSWLALAAVLLVGCAPDSTLESLVPASALAVALCDHPGAVSQVLGRSDGSLPWSSLDGGKPWAAVVIPSSPPGFELLLALRGDAGWPAVEAWARQRGGLTAIRLGDYAVLSTPGLPPPRLLEPSERFSLARVRAGNAIDFYVNAPAVLADSRVPATLKGPLGAIPGAGELAGWRLGLGAGDGITVTLATDWKAGSSLGRTLGRLSTPADVTPWLPRGPSGGGLAGALSLPPEAWAALGTALPSEALRRRWDALAPLLGPRAAFTVTARADGTLAWSGAVESRDPQAVRQALKTLAASGDVQRSFGAWALDPDTAFIYRDRRDGLGGVVTGLTLGAQTVMVGYGEDRVAWAAGAGADEALRLWRRPLATVGEPGPAGAWGVVSGSWDGLAARSSATVRPDGNVEVRIDLDAAQLRVWQERLPQALRQWLSGEGGWTRWEP